jgi:hypothetical protein
VPSHATPTPTGSGLVALRWPNAVKRYTPGSVVAGCTYPRPVTERAVTEATKRKVKAEYRYTGLSGIEHVEYDHLIPFSLCGGNDAANIWPEPADGIKETSYTHNRKDQLERYVASRVASHHMKLTTGQAIFRGDWRRAWCKYRAHYASAGVVCP